MAIKSMKCTTKSGVKIHENHSTVSKRIGTVPYNTTVNVTSSYKGSDYQWYKISWGKVTGWVAWTSSWWKTIQEDNTIHREDPTISSKFSKTDYGSSPYTSPEFRMDVDLLKDTKVYHDKLYSVSKTKYDVSSMTSIIGMPAQFIPSTDPRINTDGRYGRMFLENIAMDMPICTIVPGGPRFLGGKVDKKQKQGLAQLLANSASSTVTDISNKISKIIDGDNAKYYSFMTQYTAYMNYVNALCRMSSMYLGIGDKVYKNGKKYKEYDWKTESTEHDGGNTIEWLFGDTQCIHVYIQPNTPESESSSNTTDRSMLSNALNGASDMAKEADFLFGAGAGIKMESMSKEYSEQQIADISKMVVNQDSNIFKRIFGRGNEAFKTVLSGSNLLFPEIWKDSSFSRGYTIDVRLVSPYANKEAIFLNVLKPLWFLMCLAFPRSMGSNAYTSP